MDAFRITPMEMRMQTRRNFLLGSAALVGAVATGVSLTTEPARVAVKKLKVHNWKIYKLKEPMVWEISFKLAT